MLNTQKVKKGGIFRLLAERLSIEEKIHLQRIVKDKDSVNMIITYHFFERWNERIERPKFEDRKSLANYLEYKVYNKGMQQIKNNHHIIDDDIVIVAKRTRKKNEFVLLTTYGSAKNNPILYNMCVCGDIQKNFSKYGKLNLDYIN